MIGQTHPGHRPPRRMRFLVLTVLALLRGLLAITSTNNIIFAFNERLSHDGGLEAKFLLTREVDRSTAYIYQKSNGHRSGVSVSNRSRKMTFHGSPPPLCSLIVKSPIGFHDVRSVREEWEVRDGDLVFMAFGPMASKCAQLALNSSFPSSEHFKSESAVIFGETCRDTAVFSFEVRIMNPIPSIPVQSSKSFKSVKKQSVKSVGHYEQGASEGRFLKESNVSLNGNNEVEMAESPNEGSTCDLESNFKSDTEAFGVTDGKTYYLKIDQEGCLAKLVKKSLPSVASVILEGPLVVKREIDSFRVVVCYPDDFGMTIKVEKASLIVADTVSAIDAAVVVDRRLFSDLHEIGRVKWKTSSIASSFVYELDSSHRPKSSEMEEYVNMLYYFDPAFKSLLNGNSFVQTMEGYLTPDTFADHAKVFTRGSAIYVQNTEVVQRVMLSMAFWRAAVDKAREISGDANVVPAVSESAVESVVIPSKKRPLEKIQDKSNEEGEYNTRKQRKICEGDLEEFDNITNCADIIRKLLSSGSAPSPDQIESIMRNERFSKVITV